MSRRDVNITSTGTIVSQACCHYCVLHIHIFIYIFSFNYQHWVTNNGWGIAPKIKYTKCRPREWASLFSGSRTLMPPCPPTRSAISRQEANDTGDLQPMTAPP